MPLSKEYSRGPQNIITDDYQVIRLSEGCPHRCQWCYEWRTIGQNWAIYPVPQIMKNEVRITDMNLLAKKEALDIIRALKDLRANGKVIHYWLVCGIDYRFLTQEISDALKASRFIKPHIAWDNHINQDKRVKDAVKMLLKSGYQQRDISIFMICNHPTITYEESLYKLELCKYWNIKVCDCYFDNQLSPNIEPIGWTADQIKSFRRQVRKHNQIANFGIDPELKSPDPQQKRLNEIE